MIEPLRPNLRIRRAVPLAAAALVALAASSARAQPASVNVPGNYQHTQTAGGQTCGDWDPACPLTFLANVAGNVWKATFTIPAGSYEYKAALDGSWNVNYGANATQNGANIPFTLAADTAVRFYYSDDTHWVTSSANSTIATVPGDYQSELGCPGDWQPDCLLSWLQDPDGDGTYTFSTTALPAGSYQAKVAIDESWTLNYGAGGVQNGDNIAFSVPANGVEVLFGWNASSHVLTITVGGIRGNLGLARAHWVAPDLIAWDLVPSSGDVTTLHADPAAGLTLAQDGVHGGESFPLTWDPDGLPPEVKARFPHLAAYQAYRLPAEAVARAPELLKDQLAIASVRSGFVQDATSLQLPGVLDALFANDARLGVTFDSSGRPTLRVWAPTARRVGVRLFADSSASTTGTLVPMTVDPATGNWSLTGERSWYGKYYLYEVEVYARTVNQVVTNLVTDPYSVSLATNSTRSQIVSLADPAFAPDGWRNLEKPPLAAPTDIVLYELHVRDFSATDPTVAAPLRGTYLAFAADGTNGTEHLAQLARAGVTHVHLLPAFDFATVNEDRSTWQQPAGDLASFGPASQEQQARTTAVAGQDGFNWGYDPLHYTVPEGSYALHPDGAARTREFRTMVQALNRRGLRVVMDVVYNHTNASGQADRSVLDRIVPGYYHRLSLDGAVETSTCCQNTASEHAMMEKLMVDSVVTWARDYKVDGFRFDLMGHHMKRNMLKVRAALDALTPEKDGVDGKRVYVYGEGWNFGEVANDARGTNATQLNMAGTGIGTFTDRLRDAVRGGSPFSARREQGFGSGLYLTPNEVSAAGPGERDHLLADADMIRVGMAANLAGIELVDRNGASVTGSQLDYNGQPAGYAKRPDDTITYISAHDNETWFDALNVKLPVPATLAERERAHAVGLGVVALSQGVPFFHAGDELMRSKSCDKNSYDSGDWWNRIDWTGAESTWGSGLPPAGSNQADWPVLEPLLADPSLKPTAVELGRAERHLEEFLRIRRSSALFRLRSADQILAWTTYPLAGPAQPPGVVMMRVAAPQALAGGWAQATVVVNASPDDQTLAPEGFAGQRFELHPLQQASFDPVVRSASYDCVTGTFTVPARTVAVFMARLAASNPAQGCGRR
ncbi:pullulanase-type alpha-1,6-glucosidase [Anaeromyxobacter oryzae]|uniref:Alpha-1,6-glucosidase n=1 Tax=Anaeromyxobacter oryzae TaxID=2918170 RepID=A0ABM7X0G3_9BACT|nr:pullulanase-type alpha-1,6-glucosidase [Anaeromyxobacter oryzae]BDG05271.1 alpha-1,6-glucosidase [Anaeromyxobacter oryzae]